MLAELSVFPLDKGGEGLSKYVAESMEILGKSLSLIVNVAGLIPEIDALLEALLRVKMTVSAPSTVESSAMVTSKVCVVTPAV